MGFFFSGKTKRKQVRIPLYAYIYYLSFTKNAIEPAHGQELLQVYQDQEEYQE